MTVSTGARFLHSFFLSAFLLLGTFAALIWSAEDEGGIGMAVLPIAFLFVLPAMLGLPFVLSKLLGFVMARSLVGREWRVLLTAWAVAGAIVTATVALAWIDIRPYVQASRNEGAAIAAAGRTAASATSIADCRPIVSAARENNNFWDFLEPWKACVRNTITLESDLATCEEQAATLSNQPSVNSDPVYYQNCLFVLAKKLRNPSYCYETKVINSNSYTYSFNGSTECVQTIEQAR